MVKTDVFVARGGTLIVQSKALASKKMVVICELL